MTSKAYLKALKEHLSIVLRSGYFMQDNAPIHTGRIDKAWFKEERVEVLNWSPYPPDLNSIENLLRPLKHGIYEQDQGLFKIKGTGDDVQERLVAASVHSWYAIKKGHFSTLASSMLRCCPAVINAEGWYIGY